MTIILNLTQHSATAVQLAAGVVDFPPASAILVDAGFGSIGEALTFANMEDATPPRRKARARLLAGAAAQACADTGARSVMIGGAPYLMGPLEEALREFGLTPVYAFSERVSVEVTQPDGTVRKTTEFCHCGFV